MSDIESSGFISLADFANLNTDDIAAIASRVPDAGVFHVRGEKISASLSEANEKGPGIYRFNFSLLILDGKPIDKSKDIEKLLGKKINQSYSIYPKDMNEGIGLLKGMYQKVGLPFSGMAPGGVEGQPPGWLDTVIGHEFDVRIRTAPDNTGNMRAYFDWLPPAKEAASVA